MSIDPSTLTRSIQQRALSADLAGKVRTLLDEGFPTSVARPRAAPQGRRVDDQENSVHILRIYLETMPQVETALKAVLGRSVRRDG